MTHLHSCVMQAGPTVWEVCGPYGTAALGHTACHAVKHACIVSPEQASPPAVVRIAVIGSAPSPVQSVLMGCELPESGAVQPSAAMALLQVHRCQVSGKQDALQVLLEHTILVHLGADLAPHTINDHSIISRAPLCQ